MKKVFSNEYLRILTVLLCLFSVVSCATTKGSVITEEQKQTLEIAEKEKEIGDAAFAKLAGKYGVLRDEALTAYLNKFGKSIALYCERQEFDYFFAILDTDTVNAYSLPGGYVLITKGALKALQTPGELAGVIAHELGHINKFHITNNVRIETKMNFFEILARFIAGPRQAVSTVAAQISDKIEERLFIEGFDSDTEFEADEYAGDLLTALNVNVSDYVAYLQRLEAKNGEEIMQELDRTHPPMSERLTKLEVFRSDDVRVLPAGENFNNFMNHLTS
ncbi:MAG: M48 family metalloprotease, partial [Spirochaetales bacterium]|nr:M48 family metalloprotease [Spirochaetales bacterium]